MHGAYIQFGDSSHRRQHIADSPRLTTTFGNHPSGLSGDVTQRNCQQSNPVHPAHLTQILFIDKEKNDYKEQDEISAQDYHYTECVEVERNIRNQLVHVFDISVAKIGNIFLQYIICNLRIFLVSGTLCSTIGGQCADSRFTTFYLLGSRESLRSVFQLIPTFDDIRNARNVAVHITLGKERKHTRDFKTEEERIFSIVVSLLFRVQYSYSDKTDIRSAFIQTFHCCQFHRLCLGNLITGTIARPNRKQRCYQSEDCTNLDAGQCKLTITFLQQVPTTDTDYKNSTQHPAGQYRVEELIDCYRRGSHRPKINHLITDSVRIEFHAYRMLHPCVGNENPPGRNRSSQSRQPGGSQVETFTYFSPSEKHNRDKRSFHKECQNTFNSQRSTEDIPYKPRIIAPVRTDFKLQNQPRCHTDGKVNTEKFHPKLGSLFPKFVACFIIQRLHDSHHHCQSECEGNKNPVVHGCHRKLGSRPIDQRGVNTFNHNPM